MERLTKEKQAVNGYDALAERAAFLDFCGAPGASMLDIGAGHGKLALLASNLTGCKVTCIDPDPERIERARATAIADPPRIPVTFEAGDGRRLRYPDGSFEVVTCYSLFHHLAAADREEVLREAWRACRRVLAIAELTVAGARYFDEVLHPGENHSGSLVDPGWFVEHLEPFGTVSRLHRHRSYFIKVEKP